MVERKVLKTVLRKGGGPPPGYEWHVGVLSMAQGEARQLLPRGGYLHLSQQIKELARVKEPTTCPLVDQKPIEDFHEIRDQGGIFGNANVRLFYGIDHARKRLVVLGIIKKQNNGKTPTGDKVIMRNRWRAYKRGDYGDLL